MSLKHVAVTQRQFDYEWNRMPAAMRFWAVDEPRYKSGISCVILNGMLLWVDYLMPEDQWSEEVENAVETERSKEIYKESEVG